MTKYFKSMRQALEEARQFRDPKTELKIVKNNKVIVIDKSEWPTYKVKGWLQAEEVMKYKSSSAKEKGPIGIQLHGSRNMKIDFKDISVKELQKNRKFWLI